MTVPFSLVETITLPTDGFSPGEGVPYGISTFPTDGKILARAVW
jgi:hypothetical protein